jgi:exonuclease SbcC
MRPHKLTLGAFGPYAAEQVVDFDQLDGRNLFLITGPTGAGKTTVFDAICFALFGRASSMERDGAALRSHFAAGDAETFVELEFSLGHKRYWVRRSPWQLRPKKRGSGLTESEHDAEFKEMAAGSVAISKPAAVDPKIVETLGLTYEQFRQIVMVPQGEFRKLITAGTREREDIFRKIFGTEQFLLIQNKLFEKAKLLEQELKSLQGQLEQTVRRIDPADDAELAGMLSSQPYDAAGILAGLERLLGRDEIGAAALKDELDRLASRLQDKQKELFQAEELQRKLTARDAAAEAKLQLENRKAEIEAQRQQAERARKAATVRGAEENRQEWAARRQDRQNKLSEAAETLQQAVRQLAVTEAALADERQRDPQRAELQANQTRLEGLVGKVANLDGRRSKLAELARQAEQAEAALVQQQQQMESHKQALLACQAELEQARAAVAEAPALQQRRDAAETSQTQIDKLGVALKELAGLAERFQEAKQLLEQAEQRREQAETAFEAARNLFLQQQAAVLASRLQPGSPCPVCGSSEHPQPATAAGDAASEAELKELEQTQKTARSEAEQGKRQFDGIAGERQKQQLTADLLLDALAAGLRHAFDRIAQPDQLAWLREARTALQTELRELRQRLLQLEQLKQREQQLAADIDGKQRLTEQLEQQAKQLTEAQSELLVAVRAEQELLRQLEAELPESVRTQESLAEALQRNRAELQALQAALEQAAEARANGDLKRVKAETAKAAAQTALDEAAAECVRVEEKFQAALVEAGFADAADYVGARLEAAELLRLETAITDYFEQLRSACDNFARIDAELAGVRLVEIAPLQQQLADLKQEIDRRNEQAAILYARQKSNRENLAQLSGLKSAFDGGAAQYAIASDLAKVARGDNSQRMSFERYILAAYFDEIVAAANLRLAKMTAGRYEMRRIDEKGKGGGQFGLELEVLDFYTGKYRHVKTLSGGEGFKASLALALGLADVVQAHAGCVVVDTMFVDEGFGTLDPESLQSAINCLIDLQRSGRLVGIISHVPELKDEIDARLEVQAGNGGSSARFVIGCGASR